MSSIFYASKAEKQPCPCADAASLDHAPSAKSEVYVDAKESLTPASNSTETATSEPTPETPPGTLSTDAGVPGAEQRAQRRT